MSMQNVSGTNRQVNKRMRFAAQELCVGHWHGRIGAIKRFYSVSWFLNSWRERVTNIQST